MSLILLAALGAPEPVQFTENAAGYFPRPSLTDGVRSMPPPQEAQDSLTQVVKESASSGAGGCPAPCLARLAAVLHRLRGSPFCPNACRGASVVDLSYTLGSETSLQPADVQHPLQTARTAVRDATWMLQHASVRGAVDVSEDGVLLDRAER